MKLKNLIPMLMCLYASLFPVNTDYLSLRKEMIEKQIVERGITNERIINAFLKVKRHLFVKPGFREKAYADSPLDIGEDQVINRPYIVAMMTYVIAPGYNKKVLEIGTGSGFHAAILAELVKEVYTIEIEEKLAKRAKETLSEQGYRNIKFKTGDGSLGWEEYAPFDGIICTYSPDHIPPRLLEQLAIGGRMIIEVSHSSKVQEFILIEKDNKGALKRTNLIPVQFTPLIRGKNEK
jgi:protein-L-isoaspartate(D-aspartate) O-methyltransferase